jgi:hypothetical protein
MKNFSRKFPGPKWKLCLRIAGVAAGLWALFDIVLRHH